MLDALASLFNHPTALVTDATWTFFVVLAIILAAPLLRRVHIPHIVALILAGVLVGPHGIHLIDRDRSFEIFGQVGVYYIMFMAALELDMGSVKRFGQRGFWFGMLTFLIPFIIGFATSRTLLGMGALTAVIMGCIYGSHTLVSYPIVGHYGLQRHRTVVVAVVSTALATFAALMTLAVSLEMRGSQGGVGFLVWFFVRCVLFFMFMGFVLPRVARTFIRKYNDPVIQFIFVLSVMYLSAGLADVAGLEGLLGAFLAGLVMGRFIPRTSPLMNRIEFVGNALFIPYFLIGVGMIVNLRVMFQDAGTLWMLALVVAVATLTKLLPAVLYKYIWREPWCSARLMFGLTDAHSAGALAIVLIASDPRVGLMDVSMVNATVLLILCSCIISSLATNSGARELALKETEMEDNQGSFHGKCLVTYSQAENVDTLTQLGILIRNPFIPDNLMGLNVAFTEAPMEDGSLGDEGRRLLEQAEKTAAAADVNMATLSRMSTNVASGILYTMREYDCGEVVMCLADRTTQMPRSSLGTIIDNVVAGSHRQIMALRSQVPLGTLRSIVVAVPKKAEYEVGFYKWLEHICRMGEQLDCRISFHAHQRTLPYISAYMHQLHGRLRVDYVEMELWGRLLNLAQRVGEYDLLIVVTSRPGFISYRSALEGLPIQLHRYFSHTNVLLLYPDQQGDPGDAVSIFAPNGQAVTKSAGWWVKLMN